MIKAAGIMIVCGNSVLLLKRGNGGDYPNFWAFPGGKLEEGENPEAAAVRETFEETGFEIKEHELKPWTRTLSIAPNSIIDGVEEPEMVDFTTFTVKVSRQAVPKLCDEHTGFAWVDMSTIEGEAQA